MVGLQYIDRRTEEAKQIDRNAPALRLHLETKGHATVWPKDKWLVQAGYSPDIVKEYCVNHVKWQALRLSMKGIPTHEKMQALITWAESHWRDHPWATEVQVGNYLGALRRGGQLDDQNRIRKYL